MCKKVKELTEYKKYENDNLLWKRRVENIANNGQLIGSDDIKLGGYNVKWSEVWKKITESEKGKNRSTGNLMYFDAYYVGGWERLFYYEEDNLEYFDLALDMKAESYLNEHMSNVFRSSLILNKPNVLRRILSNTSFDPNKKISIINRNNNLSNILIYPWSRVGTASTIAELMKHPKFDPSLHRGSIIFFLSSGGSLYNKYLAQPLANERMDRTVLSPEDKLENEIKMNEEVNKLSLIIKELLNDPRTRMNSSILNAVKVAYDREYEPILKVLLDDIRVRNLILTVEDVYLHMEGKCESLKDLVKYRYEYW